VWATQQKYRPALQRRASGRPGAAADLVLDGAHRSRDWGAVSRIDRLHRDLDAGFWHFWLEDWRGRRSGQL
jgi:hypothetical protein